MMMMMNELHRYQKLPQSTIYKMGDEAAPDRFLRLMRAASCREAVVDDVGAQTYVQLHSSSSSGRATAPPYPTEAAQDRPSTDGRIRSSTAEQSLGAAADYYCSDNSTNSYGSPSAAQSGERRIDDSKHSVSHALMSWARRWWASGVGRRRQGGGHTTSSTTDSGVITSKQYSSSSRDSNSAASSADHSTGVVARRLQQMVASPIICSAAAGSVVISSCTHTTCSDIQHDVAAAASRIHRRRSRRHQHNASFHYDSVSYALNFDDGPHHFAAAVLRRTSSSGNGNNIISVPF